MVGGVWAESYELLDSRLGATIAVRLRHFKIFATGKCLSLDGAIVLDFNEANGIQNRIEFRRLGLLPWIAPLKNYEAADPPVLHRQPGSTQVALTFSSFNPVPGR